MKVKKILEYKLKQKRNISSKMPLIIGDRLFVVFNFMEKGLISGKVMCLDKNSFQVFWEYDYPFLLNNILKSNRDSLLVCCMDGKLQELNLKTGESLKSLELEMDRCGKSSSISEDKIVFGGIQRTEVANCLDLSTSEIKWSFNTGGHSYNPLIANGRVYLCTDGNIRCIDLNSGKLIWENIDEISSGYNPILFNEMILVGGHGLMNIYHPNSGKLLHQIEIEGTGSIWTIISENDSIYFGDGSGQFFAYKITQTENKIGKIKFDSKMLWRFKSDGNIQSSPIINEENVMFINDDKKLICLNKETGEHNWTFNTKGEAGISGVIIESKHIYLSVGKGFVYKLEEKTNDNKM